MSLTTTSNKDNVMDIWDKAVAICLMVFMLTASATMIFMIVIGVTQ